MGRRLSPATPLTPTARALIDEVAIDGSPFVFPDIDRGVVIASPISRFAPDFAYERLSVKLGMIEPKAQSARLLQAGHDHPRLAPHDGD